MCLGDGEVFALFSLKIINLIFVASMIVLLVPFAYVPGRAFYSGHHYGHHYDRTFFANNFSGLSLSYLGFRDPNLLLRDQLSASQRYLFSRHCLLCSHRLVHPRMTVVTSCNISSPIGDASPDKNVNKVRCHVVTCSRVTCNVLRVI